MGRVRKIRSGDRPPLKVNEEFMALEPATETTAARLTVVHLWSGLPSGPNPAKQRYAVCITIVISNVIVASQPYMTMAGPKGARARYEEIIGGFQLVDAADTSVGIVAARDHFEAVTGRRFWHCTSCNDALRIGALWCEACRTPVPAPPLTAAQHVARVVAGV